MISDYTILTCLLFFVSTILTYWNIYAIGIMAIWLLFTVKIGNQRILRLGDLMPRGLEQ